MRNPESTDKLMHSVGVSTTLPALARRWLMDAAESHQPGSFARTVAIDEAIAKCRLHFPSYFRKD